MRKETRTKQNSSRLSAPIDQKSTLNKLNQSSDFKKLYRNRFPVSDETPESCPIDPNHTHLILLDDLCDRNDDKWREYGFRVRSDLTLKLRAQIEQEARKLNHHGRGKSCFLC
jgi:hypothetical protein